MTIRPFFLICAILSGPILAGNFIHCRKANQLRKSLKMYKNGSWFLEKSIDDPSMGIISQSSPLKVSPIGDRRNYEFVGENTHLVLYPAHEKLPQTEASIKDSSEMVAGRLVTSLKHSFQGDYICAYDREIKLSYPQNTHERLVEDFVLSLEHLF